MERPRLPRWAFLWLALGIGHLGVTAVGSFFGKHFPGVLSLYGYYSGSVSNLKFFSPGVGSQLRVSYEGVNQLGLPIDGSLLTGRGETDLRIEKIVSNFWKEDSSQAIRRALAASWAGKIFARYPDLVSLAVKLDRYELPSMALYRKGARPEWRPYYYASFGKEGR